MDLLVVEKKFATNRHFTFSAEFLTTPLTPDFNVGISKHENIFSFTRGDVRPEKVRNQIPCCALPTLKSGGAGASLVAEAYVSIVSMV